MKLRKTPVQGQGFVRPENQHERYSGSPQSGVAH